MRIPPLLVASIVAAATYGCVVVGCGPADEMGTGGGRSGSAGTLPQREIMALGRVQPLGGVVSVSAIPGERLAALSVGEGGTIERPGMSLGLLASNELRKIEVLGLQQELELAGHRLGAELAVAEARQKQAAVAVAVATMEQSQVDSKEGEIALLRERMEMSKLDLARLEQLRSDDPELVTVHEIDQSTFALKQLSSQLEQSVLASRLAKKSSQLSVEAAQADLEAAEAAVAQFETSPSLAAIEHKIAAAEAQARWTELPAPCHGTVLRVFLEPGEFIAQTPILQIADLSKMACVAEVYEADIQWIGKGDPAVIESGAFGGEFSKSGIRGRVARIGNLIGPPGIRSLNPMDRTDRHVVEVVIEIDPDDQESTREISRLVGLQVTVRFVNGESE